MKTTINLLIMALLVPLISTQISFFDNRFPPAPASRRVVIGRNRQLNSQRSASLIQAPVDQQISQVYEDSQDSQGPLDLDSQEPIVQQPVPTKRPRNGQTPAPSRTGNGFTRVPAKQPQFEGVGQTRVGTDVSEEDTQKQDSALTDISMEDVSTERITPDVTISSSYEDTTDGGFISTQPQQRPITTTAGPVGEQRRPIGGRKGVPKPKTGIGRTALIPNGQQPVGRKQINGRDRQQVTQVVDREEQIRDDQISDGQISDEQISDGQIGGEQISDGQISDDQIGGGQIGGGQVSGGQTSGGRDITQSVGGGHGDGSEGHDDGSGDHGHHSGDPIQWLRDAIRGEPGVDYPIFYTPPETGFKCSDQQFPGYYADMEARCQVFHICQKDGRSDAFLCPNGTIFSQQNFVCVWWHDFDCSTASQYYSLNEQLYSGTTLPTSESPDVDDITVDRPSGGRPTGGRPSTRPLGGAPVDSVGIGPEGPADDRIQTSIEDSSEGQSPEVSQRRDSDQTSVSKVDSQEAISGETPAEEVVLPTPRPSLVAPNGRPIGGIKGLRNGRRNGKGLTKKNGSNGRPKVTLTTTRPMSGFKRNGITNGITRKTNGVSGQPSIASPADNARNGFKKTKTNGINGGQQRQRTNGGTKSVFRDRTSQKQELDGQSSNWFYFKI